MKQILFLICSITLFGLLYLVDQRNAESISESFSIPPTDRTLVKEDMESGEFRDLKKSWFESIHKCDDSTDWRLIERENTLNKYNKLSHTALNRSNGFIDIANGRLIGKWTEKGSINQSGSIIKTAYNKIDNKLYAIASGGSLWRGTIDGLNWEVVNQDLRFDGRFLDIVYPNEVDYRIVAAIGGLPFYLDAGSDRWVQSEGVTSHSISKNKDQLIIAQGAHVFSLHQSEDDAPVSLIHSADYGESYKVVKALDQTDINKVAIGVNPNGSELFLIEQTSIVRSNVYRYNYSQDKLALLTISSDISFGDLGQGNIQVSRQNNTLKLYVYDAFNNFKVTSNNGITWTTLSTLPVRPWDAGVYISPSDPQKMIMGAIEAHTSHDGGITWEIVNNWADYYTDIVSNLHADIMHIREYDTADGIVTMVSNHGGISRSFDYGNTFFNIGSLGGLNVTQYYSVKTYPFDEDHIFAGSQDQGLQRTKDLNEGPANFSQFISGDYGQLQFTNNGRSLWAVYPGGWITYYAEPTNANRASYDYRLLTNNRSIWLPPTIASPYDNNTILIGGGTGLLNTTGSHLVSLKVDDLNGIFVTHHSNFNFSISGGDVSAMAYNHINTNEFYVLTTTGKFYKSTDQGINFTEKTIGLITPDNLYGHYILTSKKDANKILVAGSGYNNAGVFVSHDGGETFEAMSEGLPRTSVFQLAYNAEEDCIFAATEAGPYAYLVSEGKWYDLAQGKAPHQRYWSVEYLTSKDRVRYGTYGRGIWDLDIESMISAVTATDTSSIKFRVYPNPSSDYITIEGITPHGHIRIMSKSGVVIHQEHLDQHSQLKLDISNYANGLYYLIFDDGNKQSSTILVKS